MRQLFGTRTQTCMRGTMVMALAIAAPACTTNAKDGSDGEVAATGSINAALTIGGARHDVTAVHYKVVAPSGTCDDPAIAATTVSLEDAALPAGALPAGAGEHAGSDDLFVLSPGDYRVCATPWSDTAPSAECAPTEGLVTVIPEATTEVVLVSQCAAAANGGIDVDVALNDPPRIEGLDITPSKYITQCETATITTTATDPDGDSISTAWEVVAGAGTILGAGSTATFTPAGPGDSTVRLTVTDALGGSASLTFPVHVSAAECGPAPCQTFGTDSFGYVGCSRLETVPSCDDISLTGTAACGGDDCATSIALPFPFDFYGVERTEMNISSNGFLGFAGPSSYSNSCSLEPQTIAPFWDDLNPPAGGAVRYQTLGDAPARRFVVQWNTPPFAGGSLLDVRAVLFEGSNDIRFCYADTTAENPSADHGVSATAGISGLDGSLLFSCNTPQLTEGVTVEFAHPESAPTCSDGVQNQGETGVDCGGPCLECPTAGSIFRFTDTPADDVGPTALYDFFTGLGPVQPSQYILFENNAPGIGGAWCSDHADFYVNNYLAFSQSTGTAFSESWGKYWRSDSGAWSGPDTAQYANYFGAACDVNQYSWCSEWDLGHLELGVMPAQTGASGESYSGSWSGGANWSITIAVGADRLSTCGF